MNNKPLLSRETSAARGARTFIQAIIGFVTGLAVVVWTVPGVQDAIWSYITVNLPTFLVSIGIPAGATALVSYLWNKARGIK